MRILTVTINICTLGRCCEENRETGPLDLTHCNNGTSMGGRHQSLMGSTGPLIRIRLSTQVFCAPFFLRSNTRTFFTSGLMVISY